MTSGTWYNPGATGSKRKQIVEQEEVQPSPAANEPASNAEKAGEEAPSTGLAQDTSNKSNGAPTRTKDKKKDDAPTHQRRRMQFMQYMRQENAEDRELVEEFVDVVDAPEGWERQDHLDDLRPSVWFRKEQHVIEVYAILGSLAAVFGLMPKAEKDEKQDYTMMNILFPPVKIPHLIEDENTGEEVEDFETAAEDFSTFVEECDDYIKEQSKNNEKNKKTPNKNSSFKARTDEDN